MTKPLKPIQIRMDPTETALIPTRVAEALSNAVGAARDLQASGLIDCVHKSIGMSVKDCVRCNLTDAINDLDEVMSLWKHGELFTVRIPDAQGDINE